MSGPKPVPSYPNDIACERCVIAIAEIERLRAIIAANEKGREISAYLTEQSIKEQEKQNGELIRLRAINAELVHALGGLILHVEELDHYADRLGEAAEMKIARKAYQAAAKGEKT